MKCVSARKKIKLVEIMDLRNNELESVILKLIQFVYQWSDSTSSRRGDIMNNTFVVLINL